MGPVGINVNQKVMKTKLFTLFVALFATTNLWAKFQYDNLYYEILSSSTAEVVGYLGEPTSVNIPSVVQYDAKQYSVTSIGLNAFRYCNSITSVTIPNSVTEIGAQAFEQCDFLASITIPNSVTHIGSSAFSGCSSLTSITIPNSVTSIGQSAFSGCSSLTSIVIGNGVTSIGKWAFSGCKSLTSVNIGNSVTSIGEEAFKYCNSLTSVTIPNSVTSIGERAFYDCNSLASVTISNSVTNIGYGAFESCNSLTSVTIPNSVTSIEGRAFYECKSLTSVSIGNSVTSIGKDAFYACDAITRTNYTGDIAGWCKIKFGEYSSNPIYFSRNIFINNQTVKDLVIPNTVDVISNYAFYGCNSLTSITIPNSVTSIGEGAFIGCNKLSKIIVENSNVVYDSRENCNAIIETTTNTLIKGCQNTNIPNSVTSIGEDAFRGCSSLTSITIPNIVTNIGSNAFNTCKSFTSITMEGINPPSLGSDVFVNSPLRAIFIPDNALSNYQQAWGDEYIYVNNENSLTLHVEAPGTLVDLIFDAGYRPINVAKLTLTGTLNDDDFTCMRETMTSLVDVDLSGITNTEGVNFESKKNLVRIILPSNLTTIGNSAFYSCSSLTSLSIGNNVTKIGQSAFNLCTSLTSITIPNSVTSIEGFAFQCCYSLTSLIIPNSVTSIGNSTFFGCSSLTSITIPNNITSIGNKVFEGCSSLTSVTIPNSVTSIGSSAFSGCSSLTSITIPNSVTSIGGWVFNGCSSLTSVNIGNSVTSIGERAFVSCNKLQSITFLGTTPPNASDTDANKNTCNLIVPKSAYNAYLRHAYWGQFLNINAGYWVTLQTNNDQWGEVVGSGLYAQEATISATPYEGYTFMRWSDGNTDNPRTIQVTSDITLTAEFDLDTRYIVTFVDWDGTVLSSVSVISGETAIAPADPTREGYTFIGWDKDFSKVTNHMTVTAQYQINRYRVRFFDYDETLLHTDSVEYQSAAVAPADPYRTGYTFIGWDKELSSITADLDIYAQYEIGENRDMTIVFTNSIDGNEIHSQSISIKLPPAPEIEGFTFLRWHIVESDLTDVITIQAIYELDKTTPALDVYVNPVNPVQKLIRNGQVYILCEGKTYNAMGQKIE